MNISSILLLILAGIFIIVVIYVVWTLLFKVPTWQAANAFRIKRKNRQFEDFQNMFIVWKTQLANVISLSIPKEIKINRMLVAAGSKITAKEFVASLLLQLLLFCVPGIICMFFGSFGFLFGILLCSIGIFGVIQKYTLLPKQGEKRKELIEKELPRFVSFVTQSLTTNRNILMIIDEYKANYDTPLCLELSYTAADMRTGNPELALNRFDDRINSPYISALVRGLISTMHGDDMTPYFTELSMELVNVWNERLEKQALDKKSSIERMSYMLFALAIISAFILVICAGIQAGHILINGVSG